MAGTKESRPKLVGVNHIALEVGDIESAVQRGQPRRPHPGGDRVVDIVDVEMDHIKFRRQPHYIVQHGHMMSKMIHQACPAAIGWT